MPGVIAALAATIFVAGGTTAFVVGAAHLIGSDDREATVRRVVDGDTIDVRYDGGTHRVRLLNTDTSETVDPDQPVQCLGPEAAAFLRGLLSPGVSVTLRYDKDRTDRYDRELAGVFLGDTLVNAEIARAGLGVALIVDRNDRYFEAVQQAQAEASSAGRGLFDSSAACTLPAQLTALESSADEVPATMPTDEAGLDALEATVAEVEKQAQAVNALLTSGRNNHPLLAFNDRERQILSERLQRVRAQLSQAQDGLSTGRAALAARLAAERRAAERAAAEAAAREAAEAAAREAAEAAARTAAAEAARAAEEAARAADAEAAREARTPRASTPSSGGGSSTGGSGGSSGGGYDGYTGCRAYGKGGTSIDEKGRRYTKISC